ncbi:MULTISPECIES: DUF5317 domain-containing protein [unclassified Paenibacillus]|uniref:DUF5317 domain-containing protein n=1 Tax=unclassified Paenibacillus TaxID=185978 RepID=UPI000954A714|nr:MULTISPECIES: DUF5317 domain-containing protein [unclassified Paenibacillus]ASS66901.1 DUF5317 domain-containing protein [Paenibacillus sp. RUD330]SIR52402.1 hypothetical protein SAMN05880555_4120 [Paenibacillus sp. RU4X]SIR61286.1 hypothetical protein SAMN05880570_4122 [Paenibacillus sp. RU4T]
MVYDGILIGLVVGFIRAGWKSGLIALSNVRIKGGWVFPLLLILQFVLFYMQESIPFFAEFNGYFYMVIYVAGLILLTINRKQKGFGLLAIGVLMNFLVMVFNGGRMPVSLEAASVLKDPAFVEMLKNGDILYKHVLMDFHTRLAFLGDIIPLGPPYPRRQAISIGDVIMNIGVFFYLQDLMLSRKQQDKEDRAKEEESKGEQGLGARAI